MQLTTSTVASATAYLARAPYTAILLVLLLVAACASSASADSTVAPPRSGASAEINRRFLDPKLDVETWKKRFEGESREVYVSRAAIAEALAIRPGMTVADIGAGTGLFEGLFDTAVGDTGLVYAVDISPRFLDHLRKRSNDDGWKNVKVVEGTETSPRLPTAGVDLVFICDTYHHFTDVPAILANIKSALRPGGRLVIVDFHRKPGKSKKWILSHVRGDMKTFRSEIETAGFVFDSQLAISGLAENYAIEFHLPPRPRN